MTVCVIVKQWIVPGIAPRHDPVNTHQATIIDFTSTLETSVNECTSAFLPLMLYQAINNNV